MEVLPCSTHSHFEWRETVGACDACYMQALFRSTIASDFNVMSWGDIEGHREEYRESLKTPEGKAAEEAAKVEKRNEMKVEAHFQHLKNAYVNRKGAVKKIDRPCKYFCHHGEYGRPTPGGEGWVEGCSAHLKGLCPAQHPDELGWAMAVEKDKEFKAQMSVGGGKSAKGNWRK